MCSWYIVKFKVSDKDVSAVETLSFSLSVEKLYKVKLCPAPVVTLLDLLFRVYCYPAMKP